MNKSLQIAKVMLIEISRDRTTWVSMLMIPILLTLVMGFIFGNASSGKSEIPVVDYDRSTYSQQLFAQLKAEPAFKVTKGKEAKTRDRIREGQISAALVIPKYFGKNLRAGRETKIEIMQLANSSQALGVSQILDGLATRFSTNGAAAEIALKLLKQSNKVAPGEDDKVWINTFKVADKAWSDPPVTVKAKNLKASEVRGENSFAGGFTQTSMGFTVAFVIFMVVVRATTILEERQNNTLGRLLTTPVTKASIISGKILGIFSTGAIQAAILIGAGVFLFGVDWGRAPLPLIVIMGVFIFSMSALGIMISALTRTLAQANSISPVIVISMAMLGGCYWPLEITPPFMQTIAKALPTAWMMQGLTDLIVRGWGWEAILLPTIALFGFGLLFLAIGLRYLRFE
ncbi:MAG: ABC transporter permease [Actinomycetia bacterium]|nr:ABC transporter permease [Actinomycetes bacterium]